MLGSNTQRNSPKYHIVDKMVYYIASMFTQGIINVYFFFRYLENLHHI